MKIYSAFGINEFIVCLGYKGYVIKEYFANYYRHTSNITFDLANNIEEVHGTSAESWKVTLIDTGDDTMTGGRLRRVREYLGDEDAFCMTYGDGVADVNIAELVAFHRAHGKLATLTATQPPGRFGALDIADDMTVRQFKEKPAGDHSFINGGFFVLSPKALDYVTEGDSTVWEQAPLANLARDGELKAFQHTGFWQPMDTLRDKTHLQALWTSGAAPWKVW